MLRFALIATFLNLLKTDLFVIAKPTVLAKTSGLFAEYYRLSAFFWFPACTVQSQFNSTINAGFMHSNFVITPAHSSMLSSEQSMAIYSTWMDFLSLIILSVFVYLVGEV